MKKYLLATLILLMTIPFSIDADAIRWRRWKKWRSHRVIKHQTQKPVGAPLDGGLLAILGAAGVAYYVARRKKKAEN